MSRPAALALLVLLALCSIALPASPPRLSQQDLANALVEMARTSRTPLIAELVWPLPMVPAAKDLPLDPEHLNSLLRYAPGYKWEVNGRIVYFYNSKLQRARFNFLKLKFPLFTMSPNLSQLKLWLPPRAVGLLEGYTSEGAVITGLGDPQLEKESLPNVTLHDVTPLDVLMTAAKDSPSFYSLIIFPSATPTRSQAEKQVNWQWGGLAEKPHPIYAQPLAANLSQ